MPQHLHRFADFSHEQLTDLLEHANQLADANNPSKPWLHGETVALLFSEKSTRTRVSFELAAQKLGANVVFLDDQSSSAGKGETKLDTIRTLSAMGIRHFVLRHREEGVFDALKAGVADDIHLHCAGEGTSAHPTQALIDALTLKRHANKPLHELNLAIVGNLRHSRVAHSNIELLSQLGVASIRLAAPEAWQVEGNLAACVTRHHSMDAAIQNADAIMMLRVQKERLSDGEHQDAATYARDWQLNQERLAQAPDHAIVLHPGPMNRGVEITDAVADGSASQVLTQVSLGVPVRMAALTYCAGVIA